MCRHVFLVFVVFLFSQPGLVSAQGRLQQVRDRVQAEEPPSAPMRSAEADTGDENTTFLNWLLSALFAEIFTECNGDGHDKLYFRKFPYQSTFPGYLMENPFHHPELKDTWCQDGLPRGWSVRLSLENGNDFDGLNRLGGSFLADTSSRFGLFAQWNYFHERVAKGRSDDMIVGDCNVTFTVLQGQQFISRIGLGARTSIDNGRDDWGFNVHLGADLFPRRPWVLSLSLDGGTLGSAGVFHSRGTVGVIWTRWELFAGYDFLQIGDVNLQGPLLGARLWF